MLDNEDLKWIATTSTELNSMLQQISRYADLTRRHKGENNYVELLAERVELALKTSQALFDRVTAKILARTAGKTALPGGKPADSTPMFSVVPPARPAEDTDAASMATRATTPSSQASEGRMKQTVPVKNGKARNNGKNPAAAAPPRIPTEIKVKNAKGSREYLLLIEDEPEVAEIASDMLADEGYKVILAYDGFEALKIYQQIGKHIGLVILDFFLPVMDGDAVFDELRELNPHINVVLSSGFAEQSKISMMLGKGLRGFIPKPYTRQKLLEQVRSALEAGRMAAH